MKEILFNDGAAQQTAQCATACKTRGALAVALELRMPTVALQQVSSKYAQQNAGRTLEKPIALKYLRPHVGTEVLSALEGPCANGVYVWGSKSERHHQTYKVVGREALFLFRRGGNIYRYGVVLETTSNESLAESLWGRDTDGELWSTVYFFARIKVKTFPAAQVNEQLGRSPRYNWQGLVVLTMKESEAVDAWFRNHLSEL